MLSSETQTDKHKTIHWAVKHNTIHRAVKRRLTNTTAYTEQWNTDGQTQHHTLSSETQTDKHTIHWAVKQTDKHTIHWAVKHRLTNTTPYTEQWNTDWQTQHYTLSNETQTDKHTIHWAVKHRLTNTTPYTEQWNTDWRVTCSTLFLSFLFCLIFFCLNIINVIINVLKQNRSQSVLDYWAAVFSNRLRRVTDLTVTHALTLGRNQVPSGSCQHTYKWHAVPTHLFFSSCQTLPFGIYRHTCTWQ